MASTTNNNMKTKKLIERNLKFSNKYTYLELKRGNVLDGNAMICDNCGKVITNIVHIIQNDTKVHYYIGTDCSDTLADAKCLFNNGYNSDYQCDIYGLNKVNRVVTEINKGKRAECNGINIIVMNDKGKMIECYKGDFETLYPELINNIINI